MGAMTEMGKFTCAKCGTSHDGRWGNLTAPRAFNRFGLFAGRGAGKTLIAAHAVREELMIPDAVWWAMGASYKLLHDSTFPTLVGLLSPSWIAKWDPEHMEITLRNGAMIAFRSLEDPDRARGPHGVGGMWFDEAAQCPERAWHVGTPMLIKAGGIAIASTTVLGYDWTYDQVEQQALVAKEPGYWCARWTTEQNPLFRANPVMRAEIERAKRTMTVEMYAQEYLGERANAQGLVYGQIVKENELKNDDAVKAYIPEWPNISPRRKILIGLDEGGDHPFGAVMGVVTEKGIVIVAEFLERMRAHSAAHGEIYTKFGLHNFPDKVFAGNKNALNLRLEWALLGTGVVQAENKQEVGIQRTHSWLLSRQLKFAYTVPRTIQQMSAYRYAENTLNDGGKKDKEGVFKLKDEFPDAIRYLLMAWPELPVDNTVVLSDSEQRRWDAYDEKTRHDLTLLREMKKTKESVDLKAGETGYPLGDFYGRPEEETNSAVEDWNVMF